MKELNIPAKLLLDVHEAATMLGLGRSKTYHYLQTGELYSIKIGRRRKIPVEAVHEFVQRLKEISGLEAGW